MAALAEAAVTKVAAKRLGMVAETCQEGRAGALLRAAQVLTAGGAVTGALFGGRRGATVASQARPARGIGVHPLRRVRGGHRLGGRPCPERHERSRSQRPVGYDGRSRPTVSRAGRYGT